MNRVDEVKHLTDGLRESHDPMLERMRQLLIERGIDPGAAVLAILFRDDTDLFFGILVVPGGRVYEFDFDYSGKGISGGTLSRWADVSSTFSEDGFADYVEAALEVARGRG